MSLLDTRGRVLNMMNECGFFLCQRGFFNVSLDDKTYQIQEGYIYYYMPTTYVSILKSSPDLEGIVVKCNLEFVMPLLQLLFDSGNYITMRDNPCIKLTDKQRAAIETITTLLREQLDEHNQELEKASRDLGDEFPAVIDAKAIRAELSGGVEETKTDPEASPADVVRKQLIRCLAQRDRKSVV